MQTQYASVSGVALSYDGNGNLTFDGTNVYDYDAENRLAEVSTPAPLSVLYSFDPLDRRVQENVGGTVTRFLYSGAQEIAEYDGLGNLIRRFVPGAGFGEVAVTVAATGGRLYHHADALGSTVARSDDSGAMVERYAYGPFGEEAGAPGGTPFRYTGQRFDAETGLYYYRARAYSPALGRFLQPDPIGTEGGINLYAYVGNDPINLLDLFGFAATAATRRGFNYAPIPDVITPVVFGRDAIESPVSPVDFILGGGAGGFAKFGVSAGARAIRSVLLNGAPRVVIPQVQV